METKYSIEEILGAVDDLQKLKKVKSPENFKNKQKVKEISEIPINTLRLIEEAEKSKN
tara:strand:- start:193 stop:366 length:174 start_codon:yes stop_codon:yes gene_type:complete